jgi:hypothetical protein
LDSQKRIGLEAPLAEPPSNAGVHQDCFYVEMVPPLLERAVAVSRVMGSPSSRQLSTHQLVTGQHLGIGLRRLRQLRARQGADMHSRPDRASYTLRPWVIALFLPRLRHLLAGVVFDDHLAVDQRSLVTSLDMGAALSTIKVILLVGLGACGPCGSMEGSS